jgi:hypothetical protein
MKIRRNVEWANILGTWRITIIIILILLVVIIGARGGVVVKAPCYKQESRGFDTRSVEKFSSIYLILSAVIGPVVYSASNRNEYQKHKHDVFGE